MKKEELTRKEEDKVNKLKLNYYLDPKKEVCKYNKFLNIFLLVLGISLVIEIIISIVILSTTSDVLIAQALSNTLWGINLAYLVIYTISTGILVDKLTSHFKGHKYVEDAKKENK